MVNHRGPEFAAAMGEVLGALKPFFGSADEPLVLTGSGTGAQEAAVVNMFSPGDTVLSVTSGVFGDRFASIAEAFGANVVRVQAEWGTANSPEALAEALEQNPGARGVILTHNETSTGVTNDIQTLAATVRTLAPDAVVLVDGVSSIGALPFELDAWQVDVAISGSQKAWMSPPGLAMVAVSERGWAAHRSATMPRFYWDFTKAKKNGDKRTTPFTPAVGVVHALQEALRLMHGETPEGVFARHRAIGCQVREGITALGLELFADPAVASDTVTAVRIPVDVDASALLKDLRGRRIVVGSGQDWLKGSIFRIGHMGWVHHSDIENVLDGLRAALEVARLEEAV
jgi:aspartate aminotransferase-like enzyme